jgi:hypothetical protein
MSKSKSWRETPGERTTLNGASYPNRAERVLQARYEALSGPVQTFRLSGDPCTVCGQKGPCKGSCSKGTRARMVPVCGSPHPRSDDPRFRCGLRVPHPGEEHTDGRDTWT